MIARGRARTLAVAIALVGCAPAVDGPMIYPDGSSAARAEAHLELMRQVTTPDSFVLRPDEYGGVAIDRERDLLYLGTREGTLLAVDPEGGDVVWERTFAGGPVAGVPALFEIGGQQMLAFGTENGVLYVIDPATRADLWSYETDGRIRHAPLVLEGVVYFVNSRDQIYAVDGRTGAWRWQYEQDLQTDFTVHGHAGLAFVPAVDPTAGDPGSIVACFDNGKVASLSAGSGEVLWLASVAGKLGGNFVDCDTTPLVGGDENRVYVAGQSTGVYALSLADGTVAWNFPMRGAGSIVAGAGGILLVVSSLEGVFAIDREGRSLWRTQLDPGSLSQPVVADDTIVIDHSETGLIALDADSGELLGLLFTGSGMSSVPIYDPGRRRVYGITNRGVLLGLRLGDRAVAG